MQRSRKGYCPMQRNIYRYRQCFKNSTYMRHSANDLLYQLFCPLLVLSFHIHSQAADETVTLLFNYLERRRVRQCFDWVNDPSIRSSWKVCLEFSFCQRWKKVNEVYSQIKSTSQYVCVSIIRKRRRHHHRELTPQPRSVSAFLIQSTLI